MSNQDSHSLIFSKRTSFLEKVNTDYTVFFKISKMGQHESPKNEDADFSDILDHYSPFHFYRFLTCMKVDTGRLFFKIQFSCDCFPVSFFKDVEKT